MTATNVDHIAVQRVLQGDRTITLTEDDKEAVIVAAYHRGMSDREIGELVGISAKGAWNQRQALGLVSTYQAGAVA